MRLRLRGRASVPEYADTDPPIRNGLGSAVVVLVVVAVLGWVVAGSDRADGLGPVPPTEPPSGTPRLLEVSVDASLTGPSAERLGAEVLSFPDGQTGREEDGYIAFTRLSLHTIGDEPVTLPLDAFSPEGTAVSPLGEPDDGWVIDQTSGLGVFLGPLLSAEISAAQDQSLVGTAILPEEVSPFAAKVIGMQVAIPELTGPDQSLRTEVPFGDSALVVEVDVDALPDAPTNALWSPIEDVDGEELRVPPVGEARSTLIGTGYPAWISNTEDEGIKVVDARAPRSPDGLTRLVRWCAPAEGFTGWEYERFDAAGHLVEGGGPGGLAGYSGRADQSESFHLASGALGDVRPPVEINRSDGGYQFYDPSTTTSARFSSCDSSPYPGRDRGVAFDLGGFPDASIGILTSISSPSQVQGTWSSTNGVSDGSANGPGLTNGAVRVRRLPSTSRLARPLARDPTAPGPMTATSWWAR